jgi:uncharacterized protein GlcG (DUF336 family)
MIKLKDAQHVIAAAEAKAQEIGQPMNIIALVTSGANLMSHVRMAGGWIGSIDISINKAFTARAFDTSTSQPSESSQAGQQRSSADGPPPTANVDDVRLSGRAA